MDDPDGLERLIELWGRLSKEARSDLQNALELELQRGGSRSPASEIELTATEPGSSRGEKKNGHSRPRATRIDSSWQLPEAWKQWAASVHHLDPQRVVRLSLSFRDYWIAKPGKEGTKLDWEATWRNWVRRTVGDN